MAEMQCGGHHDVGVSRALDGEELATGVNLEGKSVGDGSLTYLFKVVLKKNIFCLLILRPHPTSPLQFNRCIDCRRDAITSQLRCISWNVTYHAICLETLVTVICDVPTDATFLTIQGDAQFTSFARVILAFLYLVPQYG
jgi:hypothetical protein